MTEGTYTLILGAYDELNEREIEENYRKVDATAENKGVTISRLSYGITMGAEIDYLDVLTLDKALSDRKIIS